MSIGPSQALLTLLIVLILFGAGKLPAVMHDLGRGLRNFKKALQEDDEKTQEEKNPREDNNAPEQRQ